MVREWPMAFSFSRKTDVLLRGERMKVHEKRNPSTETFFRKLFCRR